VASAPDTVADAWGDRRSAEVGVLLVMFLWAANYVVVKLAVSETAPAGFNFLRLLVAAVALLVILRARAGTIALPRRDVVAIAALAAVGFSLYQLLWGTALLTTSAGDSALIIGSAPALIALIAVLVGADRFTWSKAAGVVLALVGIGFVVSSASGFHLETAGIGDALTLGAALCWATYVAVGTPVFRRVPPVATAAWAVTFGAIWLFPFAVPDLVRDPASYVRPGTLLALAFSGLFAVGLSQVLVSRAIPVLGPIRYANIQFLLAPLAVVMGAIALGEPIRAGEVAGGAVIVCGVLLSRRDVALPARLRRPRPA
jgi:drug/metabolite transporter (DMT)-like permease